MCGIIGVLQRGGDAARAAYRGLELLEYRGYDSAGIAAICDGGLTIVKDCGNVAKIKTCALTLESDAAIGHTRWATHGAPTAANAHPHKSGKFALVHNGVIENYRELKEELTLRGAAFSSDTDSEVIVKLVEAYYGGNCAEAGILFAVASAVKRLKGSFALAILCEGWEGIVAVKYRSPIIAGVGEGACVASDLPAMPDWVRDVYFPEDGDIISITSDGVNIYDFDLNEVKREPKAFSAISLGCGKGSYPHYMLKEINEDARTVRDTAASFSYVNRAEIRGLLKSAERIIVTGCGTAFNAALAAVKRLYGKVCIAETASELRYSLPDVTQDTVALIVTQSGETADTVEVARALKSAGAKVIAITNCGYSAITRIAHAVVPVCAGQEICVAATKSYLGQLAALYLLAADNEIDEQGELLSLCPKVDEVVLRGDSAGAIAEMCAEVRAVFYIGRGLDYASAQEASLKLKEVTYIFSDAYPAGELKHGTLALIDGGTLTVALICDEALADKTALAAEQVLSRGGKIAVLTTLPHVAEQFKNVCPVWLLPHINARYAPFLCAPATQLIAYRAAIILGRNPDKPRNLAKSVTVE